MIKIPSRKEGGTSHRRKSSHTKTCTSLTSLHPSVTHILLLYLGNQTLVPPPPPQHCHWCPELKNTLIADFLVAKATLETAGHCHWVSDLWFSPWPISQNWGNQSRNFKNKNSSSGYCCDKVFLYFSQSNLTLSMLKVHLVVTFSLDEKVFSRNKKYMAEIQQDHQPGHEKLQLQPCLQSGTNDLLIVTCNRSQATYYTKLQKL